MINYASPVFVSIVLYTIYALLLLAAGLTVWSVVRSIRLQGKCEDEAAKGLPQRSIALMTAALLLVILGAAWLFSDTKPLHVNGKTFNDVFWLRISDILIFTPMVLVAVIAVLMGVAEILRRRNHV